MLDIALIPEQTVEAKGDGPEIELGAAAGKKFLLTLTITRQMEQESLDVGVYTSAPDVEGKVAWSTKPHTAFPQKFYAGESQIMLDLSENPEVKAIRAGWTVGRWGRGKPTPRFSFSVRLRELDQA